MSTQKVPVKCPECDGKGIDYRMYDLVDGMKEYRDCSLCDGKRFVLVNPEELNEL
jgi:DnaJ-class molecular chaperone